MIVDMPIWMYPVLNVEKLIVHPFNQNRVYGKHEGCDLRAGLGSNVVSVMSGKVKNVHSWNGTKTGLNAYGNYVVIETKINNENYDVWYCHLNEIYKDLVIGNRIEAGGLIGFAGSTGNSTAAHLHLMLVNRNFGSNQYVMKGVIDPSKYLEDAGSQKPITRQAVINLLYKVCAKRLGLTGDGLVKKLNWEFIYQKRSTPFNLNILNQSSQGKTTQEEWDVVKEVLSMGV